MRVLREIVESRNCTAFSDDPVDSAVLERILEAGRLSPSAKNRQPWRFIVAQSPQVRERLFSASYQQDHVGQAPVIIALCTTNVDYRMPNGQYSYPMDIAMAASFMLLQAESEGLGSSMIGTYDEAEVKDILSVPYSMRVPLLLLLGKKKEQGQLIEKERKRLSRIVAYDHW
jgi:nitroreductase